VLGAIAQVAAQRKRRMCLDEFVYVAGLRGWIVLNPVLQVIGILKEVEQHVSRLI
jgi:hypothetical protein